MIRSFVALHVADTALAERLLATRESLTGLRGLKWVAPHQLHFTLKFLGAVDEARIPAAREAIAAAARAAPAFAYSLEGLGVFPPRGPARTLWAGVTVGREELVALAGGVDRSFVDAGFEADARPFSAHLTLARIKDPSAGRELVRRLPGLGAPVFGAGRAREIVLFASDLKPDGPVHTALSTASLAAGPFADADTLGRE